MALAWLQRARASAGAEPGPGRGLWPGSGLARAQAMACYFLATYAQWLIMGSTSSVEHHQKRLCIISKLTVVDHMTTYENLLIMEFRTLWRCTKQLVKLMGAAPEVQTSTAGPGLAGLARASEPGPAQHYPPCGSQLPNADLSAVKKSPVAGKLASLASEYGRRVVPEAPIWNRIPSYEKGVTFSSSVIDAAVTPE
ncbi:predicted protein [Postia placenta Mad-698-R]|nr:predicted protein [Postia placenta Mad-698-R]